MATGAGTYGVTIRTNARRLFWGFLVAFNSFLAFNAAWHGPQWFQRLPEQLTDGYLAAAAVAALAGLWRAWRMALYIDDEGVTVRNFFRTQRFTWPEISGFADGSAIGAQSQRYWALLVVPRAGTAVTAAATMRSGAPRHELLSAIQQAAQRYGIPAELEGTPPPPRSFYRDHWGGVRPHAPGFYRDPGGQPGVRYFSRGRWTPLLPAEAAGGRQPARFTGPLPAELPEAGDWRVGQSAARRNTVLSAVWTGVAVALAAAAAATDLWWDRTAHHKQFSAQGVLWAAFFAGYVALMLWFKAQFWKKLQRGGTTAAPPPRTQPGRISQSSPDALTESRTHDKP